MDEQGASGKIQMQKGSIQGMEVRTGDPGGT